MALLEEYFSLTEKYINEHGENTILLMQVGAFFEVYGKKNKDGTTHGSKMDEYCKFSDLAKANKTEKVLMAGFRDYMLEKYLRKIQDNGYTGVVYVQDNPCSNTTRSLQGIYSPGTYFSCETDDLSNNIACVWFHEFSQSLYKKRNILLIGMCCIDILTGKCILFESEVENIHNPSSYDEVERFMVSYMPSEVILINNFQEERKINDIINFIQIKAKKIHTIGITDIETNNKIKKCEKQVYQNEMYRTYFNEKVCKSLFEQLSKFVYATQSFVYLLDYIYEHNPNLVDKLQEPIFENNSNRLILANHSLKQLNILEDQNYTGKYSSVLNFLNNCVTPMGKRRFRFKLLHPTFDRDLLKKEYENTEFLLKNLSIVTSWKEKLDKLKDVEKINRQLILKKINPRSIFYLHESLQIILTLNKDIYKKKRLKTMFEKYKNIDESTNILIDCIENFFNIDMCRDIDNLNFDINFIKENVDETLDINVKNYNLYNKQLRDIQHAFSDLIKTNEKNKKQNEYVKIHETEKMGLSLVCTKRRGEILKSLLKKNIDLNLEDFEIDTDVTITPSTTSNCSIHTKQIYELCNNISKIKTSLKSLISNVYYEFMNKIKNNQEEFKMIIDFVTELDLLQNQTLLANKYNYCKPTIDNNTDKSSVNAVGIRHVLVEHLNQNELYVTNDISLGDEKTSGILLYGTNAVGKTCLIRALGICIIMAQSGLYVPCESFNYVPYESLYTRILGNDNIFKGLSTFGVEMSELRVILKYANEKSLILGDELCSGTEYDSASSIFVSGLQILHDKNSNFIFATHMHHIVDYEEVKQLNRLIMKHLVVRYDKIKDKLIYDRKLKDGCGESMYGLEVCESLHMDNDFLENAKKIRNKYKNHEGGLSLKQSRYNSKQIMNRCEICNKKASEVHHLQYQKNAIDDKIDFFHKNHKANLLSICEECHNKIHRENKQYRKVITSEGFELQEI